MVMALGPNVDRSYFRKYNLIALCIVFGLFATLGSCFVLTNKREQLVLGKRKADVAEFRAAFMTDCLDAGRRPHECIVMWSAVKIDDWR